MGVVSSIMVGRFSAGALAAVALGNLCFVGAVTFGAGVLTAVGPVIAQAVGAIDAVSAARALQRGLLFALLLSLPTTLVLLTAEACLTWLGQPPEVVPMAAAYVVRLIPGVLPFFVFTVFRHTLQAFGRMRPILIAIVGANVLNIGLGWIFIYGHAGIRAMGANGAAWATTSSRWLMASILLGLAWPELRPYLRRLYPEVVDIRAAWRMFSFAAPIGFQYLLEAGSAGIITILIGWLGTGPVAAHQIALNVTVLVSTLPLGISSAATVLVGRAVGQADVLGARRAARGALILGAGVMVPVAVVLLGLSRQVAEIYSHDAAVVRLAATLLPIAGAFQLSDALQVVAIGVLCGLGDTRTPFVISLVGLWIVGFPIGLYLAFGRSLGAAGLWWGLVAGLTVVAILLLLRIRRRVGQQVARLLIDHR